ncbi:hypothetical protein [Paenibacillus sp.]|uniref:hypothetical protein n=1 Tax=Paenibacillus sp. TaxID=58172 RepID=UPI0028A831AF|nr:hypothetical protein [Paenibacillus sp.]
MDTEHAQRILRNIEYLDKNQLAFLEMNYQNSLSSSLIENFIEEDFGQVDQMILDRTNLLNDIKISNNVPVNTRLRFVKKAINKLIKVFSMQQIKFNSVSVELDYAQNKKMNMLLENISLLNKNIICMQTSYDLKIKEMTERIITLENELNITKDFHSKDDKM